MKLSFALLAASVAATSAFAPQQMQSRTSSALNEATLKEPPLSPLTLWGDDMSDIRKVHAEMNSKPAPEFAPEMSAKSLGLETTEQQLAYLQENAMAIKEKMQECGAVVFRDWDLMKTQDGFQDFYNAVGMKVCLDPLHSVSARPTVDGKKNSPVYEAVNKESRKNFFIGKFTFVAAGDGSMSAVRLATRLV